MQTTDNQTETTDEKFVVLASEQYGKPMWENCPALIYSVPTDKAEAEQIAATMKADGFNARVVPESDPATLEQPAAIAARDAAAHDEVLANFSAEYRKTIEKIKRSSAASDEVLTHPFLLAKMALLLTAEGFAPINPTNAKELKNLRCFV